MKLFLIKKKLLTALACLLAAAAMFYIVNHPAVVGTAATTRQLPIYCVQRDYKVLSISFDAAWGDVQLRQPVLSPQKSQDHRQTSPVALAFLRLTCNCS